jgi:glycosyltransferase involved in cell wall biosynthesis
MITPLVSIITPTFNHERFIGSCIDSVLAQTYTNWEMIVIDDGSTDGTWGEVMKRASGDSRIRPMRQDNKGIGRLAETYNAALAQARGSLVAVLEGDDCWPATKLERQVPVHVNGRFDLSFGQMQFVDIAGKIGAYTHPPAVFFRDDRSDIFPRLLRGEFFIPPVTVMIDREVLRQIGGFQQPAGLPVVDYPTWLTIAARGAVEYIPEVLGYWRQSAGQATWKLGREVAYGNYRFAKELAAKRAATDGQQAGSALDLMSDNRRHNLADASLKGAVIACHDGRLDTAFRYCLEIAPLRHNALCARCFALIPWVVGKRLVAGLTVWAAHLFSSGIGERS